MAWGLLFLNHIQEEQEVVSYFLVFRGKVLGIILRD